MFSFKKFLPSVMHSTKWGDLAEVWQSIWSDIKRDKVTPIFTAVDPDTATESELKLMLQSWGYTFLSLTGYTETRDFLNKEALFCVNKIKTKTTQAGFVYTGIPFNLISTGYAITYDTSLDKYFVDETLEGSSVAGTVALDREMLNISYYVYSSVDGGLNFDNIIPFKFDTQVPVVIPGPLETPSYLDSDAFPQLDGASLLYTLTRNFAFNYVHKFVENPSEYMSMNTLNVLYSDVKQMKRTTDRAYFEPKLEVVAYLDNTPMTMLLQDYLGNDISTLRSILISNLGSAYKVRFGNGAHVTVDISITDVASFSFEKILNIDLQIKNTTTTSLDVRGIITELQKFLPFTEVAIMDSSNNCLLYATFPKIQWYERMFSNIELVFTLI